MQISLLFFSLSSDRSTNQDKFSIGAHCKFASGEIIGQAGVMKNRPREHSQVPYFHGMISVSGDNAVTVGVRENACKFLCRFMSFLDDHFRPMIIGF